jgi:hypothetical protein
MALPTLKSIQRAVKPPGFIVIVDGLYHPSTPHLVGQPKKRNTTYSGIKHFLEKFGAAVDHCH